MASTVKPLDTIHRENKSASIQVERTRKELFVAMDNYKGALRVERKSTRELLLCVGFKELREKQLATLSLSIDRLANVTQRTLKVLKGYLTRKYRATSGRKKFYAGDLACMAAYELLAVDDIGVRNLKEIETSLYGVGLQFNMDTSHWVVPGTDGIRKHGPEIVAKKNLRKPLRVGG